MKPVMNGDVVAWYEATYDQLPKELQPSAKKDWSSCPKQAVTLTFLVEPDKSRIWGSRLASVPGPKPVPAPSKDDITRKLIDDLVGKASLCGGSEATTAKQALLKHLGLEK